MANCHVERKCGNMRKEQRKLINEEAEKEYPGIHDYSLKCISDEIMLHALKESLSDEYILDISEVKEDYDLNHQELLKVLYLLKNDQDNVKKAGFQLGHPNYFALKLNKAKVECIEKDIDLNEETYDKEKKGLSFLGKTWMKGLIYSLEQAMKVMSDIRYRIYMEPQLQREAKSRKLVEEYAAKYQLELMELETQDGTETALIGKDISYHGTYTEIAEQLDLEKTDSRETEKSKVIDDTYKEYQDLIKYEQMKGFVNTQLNHFKEDKTLNQEDDDWFAMDQSVDEMEKMLKERDPAFDQKDKIRNSQFDYIQKDAYEMINQQYENHLEKERMELHI